MIDLYMVLSYLVWKTMLLNAANTLFVETELKLKINYLIGLSVFSFIRAISLLYLL